MLPVSLNLEQFVERLGTGVKDTSLRTIHLEKPYAWWEHVGERFNLWWKLQRSQNRRRLGDARLIEAFPAAVDVETQTILRCQVNSFERTRRRLSTSNLARRTGFDSEEQMWSYYASMRERWAWSGFKVFALIRWDDFVADEAEVSRK